MTRNALPREFDVARILADYEQRISVLERALTSQIFEQSATLSAASGWSISPNMFVVIGGRLAFADLNVTRTGGAISVPATGNITNTAVAQIDDPRWYARSANGLVMATTTADGKRIRVPHRGDHPGRGGPELDDQQRYELPILGYVDRGGVAPRPVTGRLQHAQINRLR